MAFALNDLIYLGIILVCGIIASIKGLIKEVLGKVAFVVGLFFASVFADNLSVYLVNLVKSELLSLIFSFLIIFAVVFIIIQLIKVILSKIFSGEILGSLDHALGFFFGLLEGFVLIIVFMFAICKLPFLQTKTLQSGVFYNVISPAFTKNQNVEEKTVSDEKENLDIKSAFIFVEDIIVEA